MARLEAIYGISGPSDSRVVGFGTVRRALSLLERCAQARGVAEVAGVLARCRYRRQRVSGHVVFLGGHDAAHQDEGLVVHVRFPSDQGSAADSECAAISFGPTLIGAGFRTAALRYQATVLLSSAVIIQASTKL